MKMKFSQKEILYNGEQLKHLFGYFQYELLGDSVVSWIGPCNVSKEHMADGEDLIADSKICGDKMLHFIIEKFEIDFYAGVALQRLIAALALNLIYEMSTIKNEIQSLRRDGDDIYLGDKKLSISIAKKFVNSVVIHFALNIVNSGTPVPTLSLEDLGIEPAAFAAKLMSLISKESATIIEATQKVL